MIKRVIFMGVSVSAIMLLAACGPKESPKVEKVTQDLPSRADTETKKEVNAKDTLKEVLTLEQKGLMEEVATTYYGKDLLKQYRAYMEVTREDAGSNEELKTEVAEHAASLKGLTVSDFKETIVGNVHTFVYQRDEKNGLFIHEYELVKEDGQWKVLRQSSGLSAKVSPIDNELIPEETWN